MPPSNTTSPVTYCLYCGYSLVGSVSPRCPECGNRIPDKDITFLPWERIKDGNLLLRFARTLLDGALRPRRLFQHLRERSEIPIIRPRAFLGLAVVTALAVSTAGSMLGTTAPTFWRQGSLVATYKVFRLLWWTLNLHALHAVFIVFPVVQLLCTTIVASLILRWAHRVSPESTLGFASSCVALTLLFLPIFVIRTFVAFLEVSLLTVWPPGGLFTDGYLDEIMILAYGFPLFFVGVTGLEISRRRMLGAAIAFCFGSWVFLVITVNLAATATLVLYGQK